MSSDRLENSGEFNFSPCYHAPLHTTNVYIQLAAFWGRVCGVTRTCSLCQSSFSWWKSFVRRPTTRPHYTICRLGRQLPVCCAWDEEWTNCMTSVPARRDWRLAGCLHRTACIWRARQLSIGGSEGNAVTMVISLVNTPERLLNFFTEKEILSNRIW